MGKAVLNVSRQTQTGEDVNASKSLPSSPLDGNKVLKPKICCHFQNLDINCYAFTAPLILWTNFGKAANLWMGIR